MEYNFNNFYNIILTKMSLNEDKENEKENRMKEVQLELESMSNDEIA